MAHCMVGKWDFLPDGYHHVFLIRNPVDSLTSLHRTITGGGIPNWADGFFPEEAGFREMWELYEYLKDVKGIDPMIVDADDLVNKPASIMKKYCDNAGFNYTNDMLRWEPLIDCESFKYGTEDFDWETDWYGTVLRSTCFIKPSERIPIDVSTLPEYVQVAIKDPQPFYEKLYTHRCHVD
ncbi:uncharacterized protein LOC144437902 [Glandiceps talaboti]